MPPGFDLEGPADAVQWSRSDLVLLRRAARERWGVPDKLKTEAIFQATKILADRDAEPRDKLAAMRLLATFDKTDQDDEKIALMREKLELERQKLAQSGSNSRPTTIEVNAVVCNVAMVELEAWRKEMTERLAMERPK